MIENRGLDVEAAKKAFQQLNNTLGTIGKKVSSIKEKLKDR